MKQKSKMFKFLTEVEQVYAVKNLLIKIHVITGWALPTEEFLGVLIDQVHKKIMEDYSDMNPDEVEFAFRETTTLEDWGKNLNLNLLDKILIPYKDRRYGISRKVENALPPPEKRPYDPNEVLNQYRGEIEFYFQQLKKGNNRPRRFDYFEETLRADGMIPEGENMDEFLVRKLSTAEHLYVKE